MNLIETLIFYVVMVAVNPTEQQIVMLQRPIVMTTDTTADCKENVDIAHLNAQEAADELGLTIRYVAVCLESEGDIEYITEDDVQTAHPAQPLPSQFKI